MEQSQKVEDYMSVICRLRENGLVRGAYIARELGVTKPTVSVALREMEAAGWLTMQHDHTVELTETGEAIGRAVLERRRVLFSLLTALGVAPETARQDASGMVHGVSDASLCALKELEQALRHNNFMPKS